jgi:protein tyrosine phosphatase
VHATQLRVAAAVAHRRQQTVEPRLGQADPAEVAAAEARRHLCEQCRGQWTVILFHFGTHSIVHVVDRVVYDVDSIVYDVDRIVNRTVDRIVNRIVDRIVDRVIDRATDYATDRIVDSIIQVINRNTAHMILTMPFESNLTELNLQNRTVSDMAGSGLPSHTIGAILAGPIDTDREYVRVDELTKPFETGTSEHWAEFLRPLTTEQEDEFRARNRYGDVLPNPDGLMRLTLSGLGESGPIAGYFNADFIRLPGSPFPYLQTQAPTKHTECHFWLAVAEIRARVIAMLTPFSEKRVEKAIRYWPCVGETNEYGPIHVMCADEYLLNGWPNITVRAFSVRDSRAGAAATPQSVVQLHYTAWPDYGVVAGSAITVTGGATISSASSSASAAGLGEFEAFIERWLELTKGSTAPPIVHCSAGLGRAGTFIAIDHLIRTILALLADLEPALAGGDLSERIEILNALEISPAEVVTAIRTHRAGSVQSAAQYAFIYEFIRHWIRRGHCD